MGNLTSQFFANVYLNELDQFVKHDLKAKYYIRYVDDFVILHKQKKVLEECKEKIDQFLRQHLFLELHPTKSKIIPLRRGVNFLGFRIFYYHRLLRKTNLGKMRRTLEEYKQRYDEKIMDYDSVYEYLRGWLAYAKHANTYTLRKKLGKTLDLYFPGELSSVEINNFLKSMALHREDENVQNSFDNHKQDNGGDTF